MADFEAEIRNSIKDLNTQVGSLVKGLTVAKSSVNEVGSAMRHHFNEAEQAARRSGHEIVEVGHALKGIGGPLGELAHAASNGFRFEGGLARVAIAAAAAGVAMNLFQEAVKRSDERMIQALESSKKLQDSIFNAKKKGEGETLGGAEHQANSLRDIAAAGGKNGIDRARGIALSAGANDLNDANTGLADAYKGSFKFKTQHAWDNAIEAAMAARRIGKGSFTENIDAFMKNPALRAAAEKGNAADLTDRLIVDHDQMPQTKRNRDKARGLFQGDANDVIGQVNGMGSQRVRMEIAAQDAIRDGSAYNYEKTKSNEGMDLEGKAFQEYAATTREQLGVQITLANSTLGQLTQLGAHLVDVLGPLGPILKAMGINQHEIIFGETHQEKADRLQKDLDNNMRNSKTFGP